MASTVQGTVIEHGSAPYKNDPDNNQSYYVLLKGDNGETRELWGMGIGDAIQAKGIKKDDNVAFYDQGLAEDSKKRNWDVERIEKLKDYPNSIENDTSKNKEADSDKKQGRDQYKDEQEEFEVDLPSSVKNSYVYKIANRFLAEQKINFYDRDSKDGSIAFEDRIDSLHTSKEDDKTIRAMLDVAQSKNWTAIKIKGTEAFKREAWLEATIRGIEVKGYKPQEKDFAELKKRQEERTQNELTAGGKKEKEAEDKEIKGKEADGEQEATKGQEYEQELLTAEDIAKDYNLPLGYAEAIVESKNYKGRESLEKEIEDAQKEFEVDREGAINHIGEVNYQQKLSSLDERVSWNAYLNGFPKEGERVAEAGAEKEYQAWKAEAMKEQEYELDDDRYRAEYAFEKAVEREGLVRSNEFDAGRDVDYSGGSEVEAEVERFHDNLAVPTGVKGISKAEATRQVEASFDRKVNTTQRNQVIEDKEAELSTKDWLAVQAWRRAVDYRFKDDPEKRQEKHEALDAKIPDILAGKFDLEPPTITQQPDIEVSTRDMGSQDRTR